MYENAFREILFFFEQTVFFTYLSYTFWRILEV